MMGLVVNHNQSLHMNQIEVLWYREEVVCQRKM
jgi:hypothetical protein